VHPQSSSREVRVFADEQAAARAAADETAARLARADRDRGTSTLALSGGSTPRQLYGALAERHATARFWSRLHVFWGDERCVASDHPDSNFAMARESLLDHLPIEQAHIHRVPTELPPAEAAAVYEHVLARHFLALRNDLPRFDVLLLGMGADGHTASLFPGDPALKEARAWVKAVHVATASPPDRITLTLPVLDAARLALFLCTGAAKSEITGAILGSPPAADARWPAGRVRAPAIWFLDRAAAT